jgi:DNA-binding MarR family transcriptional regulator
MKKDGFLNLILLFHRFLTVSLLEPLTPDGSRLTSSQLVCLRYLYLHPHSTAGDLARGLDVSCGACTRTIDRLEQKGLVYRVTNPKDRRVQQMSLSPRAKELVDSAYKQLNDTFASLLSKLTPQERTAFRDSLCTVLTKGLDNPETLEEVCLHCGLLHMTDCPANQNYHQMVGKELEG